MATDCLAHQVRGIVCIASPLAGVPLITSWLGGVPAPCRAAATHTEEGARPGVVSGASYRARTEECAAPGDTSVLDTALPTSQPVGWGPIGIVIILGYILEIAIGWSATVREYVCVWLMAADGG